MPGEQAEGFSDNWAYLKTELSWLDRVLMVAVARQRKDVKDIDRIAQSRADRATSHWWKGVISLEGNTAYDEHRKPVASAGISKQNHQQQIEARIQASLKQGISLGLPLLCDRLNLTLFEKNLVLMSLAPEVNRRYAQIYRYLQGDDSATKTDLPTVDLVLRLLCRNDQEWRSARQRLMSDSPLMQHNLLRLLPRQEDTLLNYPLKLSDSLVDYLLAEQPMAQMLDTLLRSQIAALPRLLTYTTEPVAWSTLVLPANLTASLQTLCQSIQHHAQVDQEWGFEQHAHKPQAKGRVVLLAGAAGTGKTIAAAAIAHALNTPLAIADLALIDPTHFSQLLQGIADHAPAVLLIKSAQQWIRRSALVNDAQLNQMLQQRQRSASITLLSVPMQPTVALRWQRQIDQILVFPMPEQSDRLQLWKQAFPPQVPLDPDINWNALAVQLRLSGGEIAAIARTAALCLAASGEPILNLFHIAQALEQHGKSFKLPPPKKQTAKKRDRSSPKKRKQ